jgi:hypothetical protein
MMRETASASGTLQPQSYVLLFTLLSRIGGIARRALL